MKDTHSNEWDRAFKLIKIRAFSFFITTGVPVDQLESEGFICYVLCLSKWDSSANTKFSTYFYSALNNHLRTFCDTWKRQIPAILWDDERKNDDKDAPTLDDLSRFYDQSYDQIMFKAALQHMSEQAKTIIMLLDECADEIVEKYVGKKVRNPHEPKHLKGAVKRMLEDLGWRPITIKRAFEELTEAFGG